MRRALGRGLEALLPGAPPRPSPAASAGGTLEVAPREHPAGTPMARVADIATNPDQPRRRFDPEALGALADSIRRHGLLQPLVVCRSGDGYQLIAGERRLRAARLAGLDDVPVTVREADPPDRLELALIENLQREELTPLEEAEAYRQLIEVYGLTQEEIAQRVGKSRPAVANALRLLALPDSVKAQLEGGELTAGHARAVLSVDGNDARVAFAREIAAKKLPKSEAERLARARRTGQDAPATRPDVHWKALAEDLTRELGTRVRIQRRERGGTIEIEFYSEPELERLVSHFQGRKAADRAF
jgi:ParB family chromosome partitioning protein